LGIKPGQAAKIRDSPLTLPSPARGEGKDIEIVEKSLPLGRLCRNVIAREWNDRSYLIRF
jgi:hypothetical protein